MSDSVATCKQCDRMFLSDLTPIHSGVCASCQADAKRRGLRQRQERAQAQARRGRLLRSGVTPAELAREEGISYTRARELVQQYQRKAAQLDERSLDILRARANSVSRGDLAVRYGVTRERVADLERQARRVTQT